jgi:hypothetical protein
MKTCLSVAFLIVSSIFYSQVTLDTNKRTQFGFFLGGNLSQLQVPSGIAEQDLLLENDAGFSLGILGEYKLVPQLKSLNSIGLCFNNAKVTYVDNSQLIREQLDWVYIQLGTSLNWLPFPTAKYSPYFTVGPKVLFDISQSANGAGNKHLWAINGGVGIDKANEYFHVAPELLYSYGMSNVAQKGIVPEMRMHTISLLLYFKG